MRDFGEPLSKPVAAPPSLGPLVSRISRYNRRFDPEELRAAHHASRLFRRDQPAWSDRDDLKSLIVLEQGWAYRFSIFPNGRRHISDFFGPGAICNWSRLSRFAEQDNLLFKAGAEVALLKIDKLASHLREDSILESAFKRHEMDRMLRTAQRTRGIISLPATEKLLFILLDLLDERSSACVDGGVELPFTFEEVADMVGISPIHVSRTLKVLEEAGEILREGRTIKLLNREKLIRSLGYKSFFSDGPEA